MRIDTLALLRCPYCGSRFELVPSSYHRRTSEQLQDGILACQCCVFPLVDGIPVLHLQPEATAARERTEAGDPHGALCAMFGVQHDDRVAALDELWSSEGATYRAFAEALGSGFEGSYFLYRFSDPTYLVADAVVRAVAGTVLDRGARSIDICGGSGHLTRTLVELSSAPPLLADLWFAKVWLARRFVAPGCEPVCCDGNAPLPFARGVFRFAMCSDAFQYIWTKRQFVGEMARLVDSPDGSGATVISHTHNARQWSPSHGQPLAPEAYRELFETLEPRIFGEAGLLDDIIGGGPLGLDRQDTDEVLDRDPALTIVASRHPGLFVPHRLEMPTAVRGELRLNPLYEAEPRGDRVRLRLRFPSDDYEQEYGACRRYLPETAEVAQLGAPSAETGVLDDTTRELMRQRILIDIPPNFY